MIKFNSEKVNEQVLDFVEQLNSEEPSNSMILEYMKSTYSYGYYIEHSRSGIAYDNELEEAIKRIGYTIHKEEEYNHSIRITLKPIAEGHSYTGYAFTIPNRYNEHEVTELFIDFDTFKRK